MDDREVAVRGMDAAKREHRLTGISGDEVVGPRRGRRGLDAYLLRAHAAHRVAVADHPQVGQRLLARWLDEGAPGGEEAAGRPVARRGRPARDPDQRPPPGEVRDRGDEPARVRVRGGVEELLRRSELDDPARVHDGHARRERPYHRQIVADVERRGAVQGRQLSHRPEHMRLGGHVEAGRGLVEHDHPRTARERHRQADALLLAAGELMRVPLQVHRCVWQRHLTHHLGDPFAPLALARAEAMGLEHLHELRPDPERRVERGGRVLGHV